MSISAVVSDTGESDQFVIPVGINPDGLPVRPAFADKKTDYKCPGCHAKILLKKGLIKTPHFAHYEGLNCNQETLLHKAGKAIICSVIKNFMSGLCESPAISTVHDCEKPESLKLANDITRCQEEYRLPSGRILDVAIFRGDEVVLGVEIYVTHLVDAAKEGDLECPWIELDAGRVIESPLEWECLNHNRLFEKCCYSKCRCTLCDDICVKHNVVIEHDVEKEPMEGYTETPREAELSDLTYDDLFNTRVSSIKKSVIPQVYYHPTISMTPEEMEMFLKTLPEALNGIDEKTLPNPLKLPGGGEVDPVEFAAGLKEDSKSRDPDIHRRNALLWRAREYLHAVKADAGQQKTLKAYSTPGPRSGVI